MKKIMTLMLVALCMYAASALAAININTASQDELTQLPGIGPVKAEAIISYRKAHDGFDSVSELQEVKGIGASTLSKLEDDATTDDAD